MNRLSATSRATQALLSATVLTTPGWAHHGIGRFDPRSHIELEGTLTGVDFVNPHSYVHFDAVGDGGAVIAMSLFDGTINRLTHGADVITMEYGAGLIRTVHMNLAEHPDAIAPSRAGHFADPYVDTDTLQPADAPFAVDRCKELAYEYRAVE